MTNLYRVTIIETNTYYIEVEANNEDEADEMAYDHPDYVGGHAHDTDSETEEIELLEENIDEDESEDI